MVFAPALADFPLLVLGVAGLAVALADLPLAGFVVTSVSAVATGTSGVLGLAGLLALGAALVFLADFGVLIFDRTITAFLLPILLFRGGTGEGVFPDSAVGEADFGVAGFFGVANFGLATFTGEVLPLFLVDLTAATAEVDFAATLEAGVFSCLRAPFLVDLDNLATFGDGFPFSFFAVEGGTGDSCTKRLATPVGLAGVAFLFGVFMSRFMPLGLAGDLLFLFLNSSFTPSRPVLFLADF